MKKTIEEEKFIYVYSSQLKNIFRLKEIKFKMFFI